MQTPRMRYALPALAVAAALGVTGCGGSSGTSKADFKKQYGPVDSQLKALGTRLGTTITSASGKTDAQLASELDGESTQLGSLLTKMRGIKAPSKTKSDYQELQSQLGQVHTDLTQLTSAARTHNASSAKTSTVRLITDVQAIKPTANRVRASVGLPQSG